MTDEREPGETGADDAVSRLYAGLPREEPPPHLDATILAAARDAASGAPVASTRRSRVGRWQTLGAIAAVLLMALLLAPQLLQEEQWATHPRASAPAQPGTPVARPAAPASREERTAQTRRAPAAAAVSEPGLEAKSRLSDQSDARSETEQAVVSPASADAPSKALGGAQNGLVNAPARQAAAPPSASPVPPPDVWLDNIRQLLEQGQVARATRELAAFRRAYPGRSVDPALLRQLGMAPGTDVAAPSPGVE